MMPKKDHSLRLVIGLVLADLLLLLPTALVIGVSCSGMLGGDFQRERFGELLLAAIVLMVVLTLATILGCRWLRWVYYLALGLLALAVSIEFLPNAIGDIFKSGLDGEVALAGLCQVVGLVLCLLSLKLIADGTRGTDDLSKVSDDEC